MHAWRSTLPAIPQYHPPPFTGWWRIGKACWGSAYPSLNPPPSCTWVDGGLARQAGIGQQQQHHTRIPVNPSVSIVAPSWANVVWDRWVLISCTDNGNNRYCNQQNQQLQTDFFDPYECSVVSRLQNQFIITNFSGHQEILISCLLPAPWSAYLPQKENGTSQTVLNWSCKFF